MEAWKRIPSFPRYAASSAGRIQRIGAGSRPGKIVAQSPLPAGYMLCKVRRSGTFSRWLRTFSRLVHCLVAEAFLGPCPAGLEVNHKDLNKANNRPGNLEYLTRSANIRHAIEHSGAYRGARNSQAKIDEATVREIRRMHAGGMGYKRLAKHFGLTWGLVRDVASGRSWKHVV